MKNKIILTILFTFFISQISLAAGSVDDSKENKDINYTKAIKLIKKAKKLEKKNKNDSAKENYEKALEHLVISFSKNQNNADTLNYLGFATRKIGDYKNAEFYYKKGLQIEPNHNGINEYLGELYIVTNRIDLAKERLNVLKSCNCKEYEQLKGIINGTKKSKY
tara:strand:- start:24 stop:515 length:492 start_codon:yes stop_codon:yes gene_type:complete